MERAAGPASPSTLAKGPGVAMEKSVPLPALPAGDKKPEYLSQQTTVDGFAMFGGGPAGMATMLLPSLPDQSYCAFQPDDTGFDGVNVVNNAEIQNLAKQLDYSPAKILEWINNEITFEPYFGAARVRWV